MNLVKNITSMDELKRFIAEHHIRIIYKPSSEMMGFGGLHQELGEDWGLKIGRNTIWIDANLRGRELYRTIKHEVEELMLMRQGMKYIPAHRIALKNETKR